MANNLSVSSRKICALLCIFLAFIFSSTARALPSQELVTSYTQCIAALNISFAELRMIGSHSEADALRSVSRRLNNDIFTSANSKQEADIVDKLIDFEYDIYRRMGDTQQLRYAFHVLSKNQCDQLRLGR